MTPLERAARAAYEARTPKLSIPRLGVRMAAWDELAESTRASEIAAFRAGLFAIREADEGALDAACNVGPDTNNGEFSRGDSYTVWTAMIDHILEGE